MKSCGSTRFGENQADPVGTNQMMPTLKQIAAEVIAQRTVKRTGVPKIKLTFGKLIILVVAFPFLVLFLLGLFIYLNFRYFIFRWQKKRMER